MGGQVTGTLSPWLQNQRIKHALPYVTGRVLDFGCGTGELARFFSPKFYVGVDVDCSALNVARRHFPYHTFLANLPNASEKFNSIVLLAVIEHVNDPFGLLIELKNYLNFNGQIILTTPHPAYEWLHGLGARVGLFSQEASSEHEKLLDFGAIKQMGTALNMEVVQFRRFLFGANQLVIYSQPGRR